MNTKLSRRAFLAQTAGYAALASGLDLVPGRSHAADEPDWPKVADLPLTVIKGKPHERGRQYGEHFADAIANFLEKEIVKPFSASVKRDDMLRYAAQCSKLIKDYSPEIFDELDGMAEGAKLKLEEVVAVTLHEEFYHQGKLPKADHCTAIAAGPPDTDDKFTYVGQTWDWFMSLYGVSQMLLWQRTEGPSLLTYAYPGLWVGAGMNSEGLAFCWTSTPSLDITGPRVGIPSYVLIAQMLYQKKLKDAIEEVRRAKQAGWFTIVLADGDGKLANIEGSPKDLAVEYHEGHLARVYYGSHKMTGTPNDKPVPYHERCQLMYSLLEKSKGKLNAKSMQGLLSDKKICSCQATKEPREVRTLDAMLFNTTKREALVTRGPVGERRWQRFTFEDGKSQK
jgi:isopenicillin-N N-acyltransferase-like protein